jgi:hypothetical protein
MTCSVDGAMIYQRDIDKKRDYCVITIEKFDWVGALEALDCAAFID